MPRLYQKLVQCCIFFLWGEGWGSVGIVCELTDFFRTPDLGRYKPTSADATAVLVMNHDSAIVKSVTINFAHVPSFAHAPAGTQFRVRDIHNHVDLGVFSGSFTTPAISSHDSVFVSITRQ
jgi:hypothetical protein